VVVTASDRGALDNKLKAALVSRDQAGAISALRGLTALQPQNYTLFLNLAGFLNGQGEVEEAQKVLADLVKAEPLSAHPHMLVADWAKRVRLGPMIEIHHLQNAVDAPGDGEDPVRDLRRRMDAMAKLGFKLAEVGAIPEAATHLQAVVGQQDWSRVAPPVFLKLAEMRSASNRGIEAIELLKRAGVQAAAFKKFKNLPAQAMAELEQTALQNLAREHFWQWELEEAVTAAKAANEIKETPEALLFQALATDALAGSSATFQEVAGALFAKAVGLASAERTPDQLTYLQLAGRRSYARHATRNARRNPDAATDELVEVVMEEVCTEGGEDDSGGGWGDAAAAEAAAVEAARAAPEPVEIGPSCDIDRRLAAGLSVAEFRKRYVDAGRPVIIGGAGAIPDGARRAWSRRALLDRFGDASVKLSRSSSVVAEQAEGSGEGSVSRTLREFVESEVSGEGGALPGPNDDPLYLFKSGQLDGVADDVMPSAYFEGGDGRFSWDAAKRNSSALFYVGPRFAGAFFHQHTSAWNILAFGAKRWYLLPPGLAHKMEPAGGGTKLSMATMVREVLPSLPYRALECTQRAGELLYVPEGWNHGVINLATSVGIVIEGGPNTADFFADGQDPAAQQGRLAQSQEARRRPSVV
jgi:hypothetical protein